MDDIQKPQPTEETVPPIAPATPAANPYAAHQETAPSTTSEPRNFLATFLLASYGGLLGLRHFYLGQKTLGFVRLGLLFGYFLLLSLGVVTKSAVLTLLGVLPFTVAYVWAIVDFFVVYLSVKTDADGQPLTRTSRDSKWAKVIFMVTVILTGIIFIGGVVFGIVGESLIKKNINSSSSDSVIQFDENSTLEDYNSNFNYDSNSTYDF